MGAETKVSWGGQLRGQYLSDRHRQHVLAREKVLKWTALATTIYQGSFHTGYPPSAGTHDGPDCIDCVHNVAAIRISRIMGSARFHRTKAQGFSMEHDHEVLDYGTPARVAAAQLVSYHGHKNGLRDNGPDRDYFMWVFPKFIYNGYAGYVQAKKATYAWEQQTKKHDSMRLNAIEAGQITYVVAETEVAGSRWYITLSGKCILASEFGKIGYRYVKQARTYYFSANTWVRTQPDPKGLHVEKTARLAGTKFVGAGRAEINKTEIWITDKNGHSVQLSHLTLTPPTTPPVVKPEPVPDPTPVTPPPEVPPTIRGVIATRNVSRWRIGDSERAARLKQLKVWTAGKTYEQRMPLIAKDAKSIKTNILLTQEQGQTRDARALAAHIGGEWATVLHGDDAGDITQAILSDETFSIIVSEGKFQTTGGDHDWVTYTRQQTATGVFFWVANLHLWYPKGGTSKAGNAADKLRYAQVNSAIPQMEKIANGEIIIWGGDFNSAKENAYDGPAAAFKAGGYVDVEDYAKTKVKADQNSGHEMTGPSLKNGRQIDRFMVKREFIESGKLTIHSWGVTATTATKPGSDHYQVFVIIDFRTED